MLSLRLKIAKQIQTEGLAGSETFVGVELEQSLKEWVELFGYK